MPLYYCGFNGYQQCPNYPKNENRVINKVTKVFTEEILGIDCTQRTVVTQTDKSFQVFGAINEFIVQKTVAYRKVPTHFVCSNDYLVMTDSTDLWKTDYSNEWTEIKVKWKDATIRKLDKFRNNIVTLLNNGSIWELNESEEWNLIYSPDVEKAIDVVFGYEHGLILTESGCVLSFGTGSRGQLGQGDLNSSDEPVQVSALIGLKVVKIAAGGWHSCAVTDIGDLYIWGWNNFGQISTPKEDDNEVGIAALPVLVNITDNIDDVVVDVACGSRHTITLLANGNLYGTGWNHYGQLGISHNCLEKVPNFTKIEYNSKEKINRIFCGAWSTLILTS